MFKRTLTVLNDRKRMVWDFKRILGLQCYFEQTEMAINKIRLRPKFLFLNLQLLRKRSFKLTLNKVD